MAEGQNGDQIPGDQTRRVSSSSTTSTADESATTFWFPSVTEWYSNLNKEHAVTVAVLCYVNLINYMDRSTVAGMLNNIKDEPDFGKPSDKELGLLQTVFVVFFMGFAPLFGYLGDRHSRKWILAVGLSLWSVATLAGSFARNFWLFMAFRAAVGVGEASYSTIAPAIISDLFRDDARSKVLATFYIAIPVGTGLGYIVGSGVADHADDWRWGLRVTPFMGLLAVLMIVFLAVDPERGQSEGAHLRPTSPAEDLKSFAKNKSFMLSTLGFTSVTFAAGSLMWWGPQFAFFGAKAACGTKVGCEDITMGDISYKFGIVMTCAGVSGVPLGSYFSQAVRHRAANGDPIVCGSTLLASVPVLFFGFIATRYNLNAAFALTFLAGLLLNCNWAIVSDMTLYIVIPTRRSIANATQILFAHTFGDAASPYLIGLVADWIRTYLKQHVAPEHSVRHVQSHTPEYYDLEFRCLQYALFSCCFFQLLGSLSYLVTSWYILDDKAEADRYIAEAAAAANASSDPTHHQAGPIESDIAPIVAQDQR